MKNCIIFCAAGFTGLAAPIGAGDLVIAADGGLVHTQVLGITPDVIVGDFDSLGFAPEGANVFPVEKDDTDCMLAVRHGLAEGCDTFFLYGSLDGPRLDHTIANFQTLQFLAEKDAAGYLIGKDFMLTVIKDGQISFPPSCQGTISVFCLGADAQGVTLRGLYYPLEEGTLTAGFPLGVSNHFTGEDAEISVREGSLLVLWDRENGFPVRKR